MAIRDRRSQDAENSGPISQSRSEKRAQKRQAKRDQQAGYSAGEDKSVGGDSRSSSYWKDATQNNSPTTGSGSPSSSASPAPRRSEGEGNYDRSSYWDDDKGAPTSQAAETGGSDGRSSSKRDEDEDDFYKGVEDLTDKEKQGLENRGFLVKEFKGKEKESKFKKAAKKRIVIGASGAAVAAVGGIFGFLLSILPYEMQHVKNVFQTNIGGVSDTVLQTRTGRLYSKSFFFHGEPGNEIFDGFKDHGLVAALTGKNIRSNHLLNKMRDAGFTYELARDANGKFTGGFSKIGGKSIDDITSSREFRIAWNSDKRAIKAEIRDFFENNTEFNSKSRFWRARKARAVYSRFNIRRGNMFTAAAAKGIDSFRLALRDRLFGEAIDPEANVTQTRTTVDDAGNAVDEKANVGDAFNEEKNARRRTLLSEDSIFRRRNPATVALEASKKSLVNAKAVARTVNLFGAMDSACQLKRVLNTVVVASRVLRATSLMQFAGVFMSTADIALTGEADAEDIGNFTKLLRSVNPDTGNDFFGGGAWQYATTGAGIINSDIKDAFLVGGGWTGTLGEWNNNVRSELGSTFCEVVTNTYFQVGATVVSAVAIAFTAEFSWGAVASNAALGLTLSIALQVVEAVAIPMIIDMVAGTVIKGDEFGDEIAAALLSGFGALMAAQSSNFGMRPVQKSVASGLIKQRDELIARNQANMSIAERYFSPNNARSLTSMAAVSIPRSVKGALISFSSLFTNPLSIVSGPAGIINNNRGFVAAQPIGYSDTSICQDGDIVQNDIAADPFCNPIYGEDIPTLSIDPVVNLNFMLKAPCADGSACPFIDINGDPADNPNGKLYKTYLEKCVNMIDVIHDNNDDFQSVFSDYCYRDDQIAHADGRIEKISPEEVALREASLGSYTFDDLEIAYSIQDGDYQESEHYGKAYAQSGEELAVRSTIPTLLERFRAYRMDYMILDSTQEDFTGGFPTDKPTEVSLETSAIIGDAYGESVSVSCDPRTIDLGVYETYIEGVASEGRICALPNLPSGGKASTPGNAYYIEGAKGLAMVNSRVSGAWYSLIDDAIAAGHSPSAFSSFRSMSQQRDLCSADKYPSGELRCLAGDNSRVATPGYSSHQAGVAIDFSGMSGTGSSTSCSGRATNNGEFYKWLAQNAHRYGFAQYSGEAWHWDALDSGNRCSGTEGLPSGFIN